jgi:hypothetical protein
MSKIFSFIGSHSFVFDFFDIFHVRNFWRKNKATLNKINVAYLYYYYNSAVSFPMLVQSISLTNGNFSQDNAAHMRAYDSARRGVVHNGNIR